MRWDCKKSVVMACNLFVRMRRACFCTMLPRRKFLSMLLMPWRRGTWSSIHYITDVDEVDDGGLSFTFFLYVKFFVIDEDVLFFLLDLVAVLDSVWRWWRTRRLFPKCLTSLLESTRSPYIKPQTCSSVFMWKATGRMLTTNCLNYASCYHDLLPREHYI